MKRVNCRVVSGKELIALRRRIVYTHDARHQKKVKAMYKNDPQWMKDIMGSFE